MSFFDFLKNRKNEPSKELVEIPEDVFTEKVVEEDTEDITFIPEKTLEGVYSFLRADFDSAGYKDALTNGDSSYRNEKIDILMWDLILLCKQASVKYSDKITDLVSHINSRKKLGALDIIESLEYEKSRIEEKIQELEEITTQAKERVGAPTRVINSYIRGFNRGMVALSKATLDGNK